VLGTLRTRMVAGTIATLVAVIVGVSYGSVRAHERDERQRSASATSPADGAAGSLDDSAHGAAESFATGPGASAAPSGKPGARTSGPAQQGYPTTQVAYALAVVKAWLDKDEVRLGALATGGAVASLGSPAGVDKTLRDYPCLPAPGTPCVDVHNANGDMFELTVDTGRLGAGQAVTAARKNLTRYSDNPLGYIDDMVDAWVDKNAERQARYVAPAVLPLFPDVQPSQYPDPGGSHEDFKDFDFDRSTVNPNFLCFHFSYQFAASYLVTLDQTRLGKPNAIVGQGGANC
jgi:hypothetical protein